MDRFVQSVTPSPGLQEEILADLGLPPLNEVIQLLNEGLSDINQELLEHGAPRDLEGCGGVEMELSAEGRDPEGRDPEGRDPEGGDPEGGDPEGRDPEGLQPGTAVVKKFKFVDQEALLPTVEVATKAYPVDSDLIPKLSADLREQCLPVFLACKSGEVPGVRSLVGSGHPPCWNPNSQFVSGAGIPEAPGDNRYQALENYLLKHCGGSIEVPSGDSTVVFSTTAPVGTHTSAQISTSYPPSKAIAAYEISALVHASMVPVAVNAPFLFGKLGWEDNRLRYMTEFSEDPKRYPLTVPLPDGKTCFEEPVDLFAHVLSPESPIIPLGKGSKVAREMTPRDLVLAANSTKWPFVKPGLIEEGDVRWFRIELRAYSTPLTLPDQMALVATTVMAIRQLLDDGALSDYSYPEILACAEHNFKEGMLHGLQKLDEPSLRWPGKGDLITPRDLILDTIVPLSQEKMKFLKMSPDAIDLQLRPLIEAVEQGVTGASFQREHYEFLTRELGLDDLEARLSLTRRLGLIMQRSCLDLDSSLTVVKASEILRRDPWALS